MYEIKLQYFKPNGKFYSDGSYKSDKVHMFEIEDEIRQLRANGKLPGITGNVWIIYVNAKAHPQGYPLLIL